MVGDSSDAFTKCMARAIYDNVAESKDELAFCKGDLLTVLEQNTEGQEGWWLCSLRGQQGICPGNRLSVTFRPGCSTLGASRNSFQAETIQSMVPLKWEANSFTYDVPKPPSADLVRINYRSPYLQSIEDAEPEELVRCAGGNENVRKTTLDNDFPLEEGQYDTPPSRPLYSYHKIFQNESLNSQILHQNPTNALPCLTLLQEYDVPRQPSQPEDGYQPNDPVMFSVASSLSSLSLSSSNTSSQELQDIYDIPPEPRQLIQPLKKYQTKMAGSFETQDYTKPLKHDVNLQCTRSEALYDVPPLVSRDMTSGTPILNKFHLELNTAKEWLTEIEHEVIAVVKNAEDLKNVMTEDGTCEKLKLLVSRMNKVNDKLLHFSEGTIRNSLLFGEHELAQKISTLVDRIEKTYTATSEVWRKLGTPFSDVEQLLQVYSDIISLSENARELTLEIQENASILFKCTYKTDEGLHQQNKSPDCQLQHSRVHDQDSINRRENSNKKEHQALPSYLSLQSDQKTSIKDSTLSENSGDCQVLSFYGSQAKLQLQKLNSAINDFLLTIERNQPPKIFIVHSKFVILSAHKLVYIGDTIHRQITNKNIRTSIFICANALCDSIETIVNVTKTAALQFPSVAAVQIMVDAVVSTSHLGGNLQRAICSNL